VTLGGRSSVIAANPGAGEKGAFGWNPTEIERRASPVIEARSENNKGRGGAGW